MRICFHSITGMSSWVLPISICSMNWCHIFTVWNIRLVCINPVIFWNFRKKPTQRFSLADSLCSVFAKCWLNEINILLRHLNSHAYFMIMLYISACTQSITRLCVLARFYGMIHFIQSFGLFSFLNCVFSIMHIASVFSLWTSLDRELDDSIIWMWGHNCPTITSGNPEDR